ncbi:MAG: tetratricopeptide repeat protein [Planctomycetota bacterium]|nr:tetratricopeptide repeat protein [Planctomycetota bacterium]
MNQKVARTKSSKRSLEQGNGKKAYFRRPVYLFLVLVCLLIAFLWSGGIVGFTNSMAKNAIASKKLDSADWWLAIARRLNSSNAETDFLQAKSERQRGNLDKMANHLKTAYNKGFDPSKLEREQTLAFASLGRLSVDMEDQLNHWLDSREGDFGEVVDAYTNGLTAISRFDQALELLNWWEQNAPWDPVPHYRIGRINEHLSRNSEAESQYRKAIAKDPKFHKATYNLARVILDQRRPDEALKFFQICNVGDSALAAKTGMARCYKVLGETETARSLLIEVLKSSFDALSQSSNSVDEFPERFVAASELGSIETELGHFSEAKKYLESALKVHPLDSTARYSYAVALRGLGLQKEAEENFAITRAARTALDQVPGLLETIRKDPHDTKSRIMIGKIVLEHQSERTGVFWIQSVFSYDPKNAEAHLTLADYYQGKKDPSPEDLKLAAYHRSFVKK